MGRPIRSVRARSELLDRFPASGMSLVTYSRPCRNPPGAGDVYKSPLDDLAGAATPRTGALNSTLCRRVGQSTAPMASECSGLSAGPRGKHVHSDLKADAHAVP